MIYMDESLLTAWAKEAGFGAAALCDPSEFLLEQRIVEEQPKLRERRQLRFDPHEDCPWIESLAVLLWPYQPCSADGEGIFIDSYYAASNAAYHAANALEERILAAGRQARANVSYPAKRAAVRAGLGMTGKNGLFFANGFGTRTAIILMATDIPLQKTNIVNRQTCQECERCIKACPAGALDQNGISHPERCLRNFMMEGIVVPLELREKMGKKLLGCDICQRVCPMQPAFAESRTASFTLDDIITADEQRFSTIAHTLAEQIGKNTARPQRVRAQAALLAGNTGKREYLPVLRQWAQSSFEAVREHALWAIERIEALNPQEGNV